MVARHIKRTSIYNLKLLRRGVHLELGRDVSLLNQIHVRDAMTTALVTIHPDAPTRETMELTRGRTITR